MDGSIGYMGNLKDEWRRRIGLRVKELRESRDWSLADLEKRLRGRLSKSRLSNYEQGIRLLGPEEALLLGAAFDVPPAYILCVDDDMLLDKVERQLVKDFRALPERDRMDYARRIGGLAATYRDAVPDERVAKFLLPAPVKSK
jgi:transcriptional regulator with XRE-family HTH domain